SHVNLTARIESYTKGGQILVSEATLLDTNSIVKVHQSMEIEPKGFTEKMTIYSVSGIGGQYNLSL
ncbi:MAG: hypothetical protein O7E52_24260, partial [Candidatus Poribacteria bacterium]|nr:hypothetical protein [Candidatus Poribacteria bacterium]